MLIDAGYEVVRASNAMRHQAVQEFTVRSCCYRSVYARKGWLEVVMELRKDFPEVKIITLPPGTLMAIHPWDLPGFGRSTYARKPFLEISC